VDLKKEPGEERKIVSTAQGEKRIKKGKTAKKKNGNSPHACPHIFLRTMAKGSKKRIHCKKRELIG